MNLHLLFSKWASCYFQHWCQSWHLLFHRNQWESIRRTLQLLSFAILWRQWTPFLIQICTEIACKTHFFWKYNDLFFLESAAKRRDRWIGSNDDGDVNEKGRKAIGLNWPNNNFARASRFFARFSTVIARLQRETAKFHVLSRTGKKDNNFLFHFLNFDAVL